MKQSTGGSGAECIALLRFPITWDYLNRTVADLGPVSAAGPVVAAPPARAASIPAPVAPPPPIAVPAIAESAVISPPPSALWEMVIPKMARPAAPRRLRVAGITPPAALQPEPATVDIDFGHDLFAKPASSFLGRHWRWLAVAAVALLGMCVTLFVRPAANATRVGRGDMESAMSGGWTRSGLSAPGRTVSVYDPTRGMTDYRAEFGWAPDAAGVGWLFRVQDSNNYYGARLYQLQPGASSALVAEHFEVIAGVETPHTRRIIPLARTGPVVRVRMDVRGPTFTLWAEGSPADYWTDARLSSGPFGFYEERGQRPSLKTVRFTLFQKGAARVAETSYR